MEENIFPVSQLRNKRSVYEEIFLAAGKTPSVIKAKSRQETQHLLCTETHISNTTLTFTSAASNPTYTVANVITRSSCPGRRIDSHDGHIICSTGTESQRPAMLLIDCWMPKSNEWKIPKSLSPTSSAKRISRETILSSPSTITNKANSENRFAVLGINMDHEDSDDDNPNAGEPELAERYG